MKTDERIKTDVTAEIRWDVSIASPNIAVAVNEGIVTLSGQVSTYADKFNAERAAQRVEGVRALAVELQVTPSDPYLRTDTDIARSAETALQYVSYVAKDSIQIMVENGWLTLTGTVDWDYQRKQAVAALRYLWGVKGITDKMTIHSKSPSDQIQTDIEAALARRVDAVAQHILVHVTGGDVTLSGTVTSWWQKELAREAAWNSSGVHHVTNELRIAY